MNTQIITTTIGAAILAAAFISGCDSDGPAEQAGQNIDQGANELREGMNEAGESISEGVERTGDKIESATD